MPRDKILYTWVVEVYRLGLEPLYGTHTRIFVTLKTLTGPEFLEVPV